LPTHKEVYEAHAAEYEALVSREDHQGNIVKAVRDVVAPDGLDVLDLGAGTGRLAGLLAPVARSVLAFDLSDHMLRTARANLSRLSPGNRWLAAVADHRRLPVRDDAADLVVSGWSVSYVATWDPDDWREQTDAWMGEAKRVLRPGGNIILFESLGTGNESPARLPHLRSFYEWLEEMNFSSRWIRTDYRFDNLAQAEELAGFFFGDEMTSRIRRGSEITLPECTGVWWMRV
jgi:ubiquinone/menaquinone biosynthesis C-methylase UbiE